MREEGRRGAYLRIHGVRLLAPPTYNTTTHKGVSIRVHVWTKPVVQSSLPFSRLWSELGRMCVCVWES